MLIRVTTLVISLPYLENGINFMVKESIDKL